MGGMDILGNPERISNRTTSCSRLCSRSRLGEAFGLHRWRQNESLVDRKKRLQLEFSAPFAIVITFYDRVALGRFPNSIGHFRGFVFRSEGFPIESRVGRPANVVVNTQVHGFNFA
jgi:hypothetical protein